MPLIAAQSHRVLIASNATNYFLLLSLRFSHSSPLAGPDCETFRTPPVMSKMTTRVVPDEGGWRRRRDLV